MKRITAIILSLIMCLSLAFFAGAEEAQSGSFKVSSFNVAGLPDVSAFSGGEVDIESVMSFINNKTMANQTVIGKYIEGCDYEIFATQEDFFYHDFLAAELKSYNYSTQWKGGVPWGDGTTVFTKNSKMTGEEHIKWEALSGDGSAEDGADVYSRKGITYVCIEIADGIFVDFYDIHADAYGDEGSVQARKDNFRQLADLVDKKNTGRPVIITGDFNISSHHTGDPSGVYFTQRLIEEEGFKDAWTELYNNGDYHDFSAWSSAGAYWGRWDSVEKFLYKDGKNVSISCDSFGYINDIVNGEGEPCSDHAMIEAEFTYTVTGTPGEETGEAQSKKESFLEALFRKLLSFFDALVTGLSNIDNIFANLFG